MSVNYVIKKNVTADVWKWVEGVEKVFTVKSAIRIGRAPKPGAAIQTAAELLDVVDVATGTPQVIVLNKVLRDNLVEQYPGDGFIGKTFAGIMGAIPTGKKYRAFKLSEVELDTTATTKGKGK